MCKSLHYNSSNLNENGMPDNGREWSWRNILPDSHPRAPHVPCVTSRVHVYYVYYMHSTCATFTMSIVDVVHCMDCLMDYTVDNMVVCKSMGLHGEGVATYHTGSTST